MLKSLARAIVFVVAVCALTAPPPVRAQQAGPTVVIVVRHGEKDTTVEGNDPPLSEAGRKRAERLADIAAGAGVEVVFTTRLVRTQQTAQPTVARLGLPAAAVRSFQITRETLDQHVTELVKEIRTNQKGKTVLVVGHSNTAPRIAGALAGKSIPDLDDAKEFDAVFVVIIPEAGAPKIIRTKY